MQKLLQISRTIDAISEWLGRIISWLVLLMVAVGGWNVIGRYVGRWVGENLTSNAFLEAQWYLYDLVFLLGAAYALKRNAHVRVDVFNRRWSLKWRAIAELAGIFLFLLPFCIMVIFFCWEPVLDSWQRGELSNDPGGLPRYPIKTVIPISFAWLAVQGLSEAIKNVAILVNLTSQEENRDGDV